MGYLDENQIHLAEFTNTTEVVRAFRNGKLHVAGLTLDEALSLRQSVHDLQVFMVVDVSHGADGAAPCSCERDGQTSLN